MTILKTYMYELFWSRLKIYELFLVQNLCQKWPELLVFLSKPNFFCLWALDFSIFLQQKLNEEGELNYLVVTRTPLPVNLCHTHGHVVMAVLAPATIVKTYAKQKTYELFWSRHKTYEVLRLRTYLIGFLCQLG